MTEYRALGHRGNIKGKAIFYGRKEVTITGTATTGTGSVAYSPTYDSEPYLLVSIPELSQTSGGSLLYGRYHLSNKSAVGFAIHVFGNAAPGLYKTATFQFDYIVIGEPND